MQLSNKALLEQVNRIARGAGELVMAVYRSDFSARRKDDASPVTEADERAQAFILAALRTLTPDIPIVAEEGVAAGRIPQVGDVFWLVDPLDGTKEFINRNDEFTVNVALVENGAPVLGVVYGPALGRLYAGIAGGDAYVEDEAGRRPIRCRAVPDDGLTVVASRSHGDIDALNAYLGVAEGGIDPGCRLVVEAVRGGCRRSRPVSPARPDDGMGHRRGTCGAQRRGRKRLRAVRRRAPLRQAGLRKPALRVARPRRLTPAQSRIQ